MHVLDDERALLRDWPLLKNTRVRQMCVRTVVTPVWCALLYVFVLFNDLLVRVRIPTG